MTITLDDLNQALQRTVEGGKIGAPVALRMHLQLCGNDADLLAVVADLIERAGGLFESGPVRFMVRGRVDQQISALMSYAAGQTLFVSVGRGVANISQTHLLLIGNHGVANLDGLELDGFSSQGEGTQSTGWRKLLQTSLESKQAVAVNDRPG